MTDSVTATTAEAAVRGPDLVMILVINTMTVATAGWEGEARAMDLENTAVARRSESGMSAEAGTPADKGHSKDSVMFSLDANFSVGATNSLH
jgi:hypothetical protein